MEPLYLGRKDLKVSLILADTALVTRTCFDKERIAQVVRNLISNSIKFTKCGIIEVSIEDSVIKYEDSTEVAALLLSVKDEGVGIPESELGEIFDAFSQSSRTKTKAGGTGLGLSICLEIIAVHKGQIWAQNNSNKQGANISFTLPSILQLTDIASNDTSF
jgi:two-component system sensor histidine kinase ChiS